MITEKGLIIIRILVVVSLYYLTNDGNPYLKNIGQHIIINTMQKQYII